VIGGHDKTGDRLNSGSIVPMVRDEDE